MKAPLLSPLLVAGLAALVSGGLLAGAHLFERVGGYPPCLLCLDQREVHWVALCIAGTTVAAFVLGPRPARGPLMIALAGVYLWSTLLAGFHAGVEWDYWDGPAACGAGGRVLVEVDPDALLSSLATAGPEGPPCEVAAWRLAGLSMAGYNALISAALLGLTLLSVGRLAAPRRKDL